MNIHGVGQYLGIEIDKAESSIGTATQEFDVLDVKEGDTVFFNPSDIILDMEDRLFTFVRAEDVYCRVREN